jgi:hypothetical protein
MGVEKSVMCDKNMCLRNDSVKVDKSTGRIKIVQKKIKVLLSRY